MKQISPRLFFLFVFLALGIALRLVIGGIGFTYDMQSYEIVAKIVIAGRNVYEQTARYNYGPLWSICLSILYRFALLFTDHFLVFRFLVTTFLTCTDLGIWYVLYKKFSYKVSLFFFLNPISIILTGFYSQFDNVAVLLALLSVLFLEKKKFLHGAILLGLSITTKHVFFAFPLWLAFKEKGLVRKLLLLCIPTGIFFFSFIPFLPGGMNGIVHNVFLYKSFNNTPLWQVLVPDYLKRFIKPQFLFFGMLFLGAIYFRKKEGFKHLFYYCLTLIIFSYAISETYFASIIPVISVFPNIFFALFVAVQLFFFHMALVGGEEFVPYIRLFFDRSNFTFSLQVILLLLGLFYMLYRERYPKIAARHVIAVLIFLSGIVYLGLLLPSKIEDYRMQPIQRALSAGDYEKANNLYHEIEINPPFAGSRFYEKLSSIRYSIEYYRNYRHVFDIYKDPSVKKDWIIIKKQLRIIPNTFPDKQVVKDILSIADKESKP
jgi:hypothetical protein